MSTPSRPQALEWILAGFCVLAGWGSLASIWNGEFFWSGASGYNPYGKYDDNSGIRLINAAALAVDVIVLLAIVAWKSGLMKARAGWLVVVAACCVGAALTWIELWYGSTFYYGEIRDKQGLPFGVNNGGALGSYIFLGYSIWRTTTLYVKRPLPFVAGSLVMLWFAHYALLSLVEKPWRLWQS